MTTPFTVRVTVRVYETDAQGHLNGNVYLQYAEHARWSLLQAAGIRQNDLLTEGVGPVNLESTIRYHRELVAGDDVDITCEFVWGEGKSFRVEQSIRNGTTGNVAAEVFNVGGLLHLEERCLVREPGEYFRTLASNPALLNL